MAFNKITGLQNLPAVPLPVGVPAGGVFMLPAGQGIIGAFGSALSPQLASGNVLTGQYVLQLGLYTCLQVFDAVLQYWRNVDIAPMSQIVISSDGTNFRIANTTGCPIGALITNGGSGLTNGFNTVAVTPSAGGSVWNTIVGGAINTTVTITAGGSGYLAPPILVFAPPANQGSTPYILPTAICTISGGAINVVTVTNQGAGLVAAPTITVVPQPGDTVGGGGVLTVNATLASSGVLLAMWPRAVAPATGLQQVAPYGSAQTAVPTFTFSPASTIAATAIMNFTVTSITNTTPGVGYTNAYALFQGGMVAGAAANTNPMFDKGLSLPQFPPLSVVAATGVCTLSSPFGGVNIQAVPTIALGTQLAAGSVTTVAVQTPVVGGASDTCLLMSL